MRINFIEREHAPERLVCEAEVVFTEECGPLAGMKLVGFSLWRSPEGEVYVTFPSRAFGAGSERRFFDYLRSVEGTAADAKRVRVWILSQYCQHAGTEPPEYLKAATKAAAEQDPLIAAQEGALAEAQRRAVS